MSVERIIRPSMKLVYFSYFVVFVLIGAATWAYFQYLQDKPRWLLAIPFVLLLIPIRQHIGTRLIMLKLETERLTLQTGLISHTRRTVDIAKIQDVTVHQSIGQRMLGVGDITMETAGESGRLVLNGIDSPKAVADDILEASERVIKGRSHQGF
jgi:uncharacterized membrane protein YdbT with pleckstrin-like domain